MTWPGVVEKSRQVIGAGAVIARRTDVEKEHTTGDGLNEIGAFWSTPLMSVLPTTGPVASRSVSVAFPFVSDPVSRKLRKNCR